MRARFFDGEHAAAHDATLLLSAGTLAIQSPDGTTLARWLLRDIVSPDGPDPTGGIMLAPKAGAARLVVDDPETVAALMRSGLRLRGAPGWGVRGWALALGLLLVVLGAGTWALDVGPRLVARLLPDTWEDHFGALAAAGLEQDLRICRAGQGQRALEALVDKLRAAGGITRKVRIAVIDDPMVNALTLPGGRVLVMRGLIDKADDGGELAGVIAHELGHVAHRDPITMLVRQMGIGLVAASLGLNNSFPDGGGIAQQLLTLSYSRQAEAAADAAGQAFLTGAGLRADGLGRFFARLETIEGGGIGIPWLATHPPTAQRLARATRSTAGALPLSDTDWQAVRAMCH